MSHTITIEALQPDHDQETIQTWIRKYLQQHLKWWSESARLDWNETRINQHLDQQGLVLRDWEELLQAEFKTQSLVRTARQQGRLLGVVYGELGRDRYLKIPTGSISWVYVSEEVRGQGVGQMLLRSVHDWMHDQGVILREVHVTQANPSAVKLYKASGYRTADYRMLG